MSNNWHGKVIRIKNHSFLVAKSCYNFWDKIRGNKKWVTLIFNLASIYQDYERQKKLLPDKWL